MDFIDLRKRFGHLYRIGHDPAAKHEPSGMREPWYFTIPCKYGEVYAYGGDLLAFQCRGTQMRGIIERTFPNFPVLNWSDDGEAIFLFSVDCFEELAKIIKPRRRRRLSEDRRRKLIEVGTEALRKHRLSTQNETAFVKDERKVVKT